MATRVIVGLIALLAIIHGLAGAMVPSGIIPLVVVLLGVIYGFI